MLFRRPCMLFRQPCRVKRSPCVVDGPPGRPRRRGAPHFSKVCFHPRGSSRASHRGFAHVVLSPPSPPRPAAPRPPPCPERAPERAAAPRKLPEPDTPARAPDAFRALSAALHKALRK